MPQVTNRGLENFVNYGYKGDVLESRVRNIIMWETTFQISRHASSSKLSWGSLGTQSTLKQNHKTCENYSSLRLYPLFTHLCHLGSRLLPPFPLHTPAFLILTLYSRCLRSPSVACVSDTPPSRRRGHCLRRQKSLL